MKKIGIMSMQRITNYGSFLQAYGLKKTIESLNYEVELVDYEFEKSVIEQKKSNIFIKIIKNYDILDYLKRKKHLKKFKTAYINYLNKFLNVTSKKKYYPTIDGLVIGSDEVFNCLQLYPVGYSRNLFGKGYNSVISYAASFGHTTLNGLKKYKIAHEISDLLKKFKSLSVRDKNSYQIIKTLTNIEPDIHLDPVLISDYKSELEKFEITEKNYIVIYAYSKRLTKEEEKTIKKFAKKYNKKIISLGFYQKIADLNLIVNPFEVLNYIKNADYVITDTFHGAVFSIKMNTKFATIIRKSNFNKLYDLLKKLKHTKQIVNQLSDIEEIYNKKIDFKESNEILKIEREKTLNYLKKNL